MKKVLIITYYWPPSGGAGVQRWLKTVKYLRNYDWEPVIYTPSNPEAPSIDPSLEKDIPPGLTIIRTPIWEPYQYYRHLAGMKKGERINAGFLDEKKKPKFTENISIWIRGNLFIPDARKFWIRPSVKYLKRYLQSHKVDAIISTGPPHSMHLIALGIKKVTGLPWIADFRDPWTGIDFYDKLNLTLFADRHHRNLEKKVLAHASRVVTVSNHWASDLEAIFPRKVDIITNGFDPDDFPALELHPDHKFSITHIGSLNKDRNTPVLWEALKELCDENSNFAKDLEIRFIGKTDVQAFEDIEKNGLSQQVVKIPYLPHDEVLKMTRSSQVLLLPVNQTPNLMGIIPGKVFEYMAAGRPILCIGPVDGDTAGIITQAAAGEVTGYQDKKGMKEIVLSFYSKFRQNALVTKTGEINKYSRKFLTGHFAQMLHEITGS